jgi:alcohol/geraniol dehydrogenase (NADP+)
MIKAYAATEPGSRLSLQEFELPPLTSHDVEIEVAYCGLCHSDLSMLKNDWGMTTYPLVPGHENIGRITQLGSAVTHLKIGQWVGLGWHSDYCQTCEYCRTGDHNLCAGALGTIVGRHGGFAERVRANAASVVPIPEGMDLKSAGPLFCGGITVFNPLVQFQVSPLAKAAVIGIGGLGHLALQFLNAWGCDVTAFTSTGAKMEEAMSLGAHRTINSRDPEAIKEAANSFDFIISTVNVALEWGLYIAALRPKGRMHFVGAPLEPLELSVFSLLMGQKSISSSPVGSPATISRMLEFAHYHNIQPVIETFPFEKVNEALDHLESGKVRYRVVLTRELSKK